MNNKSTYSIGTVAKMTGIPKYKLRHWCNRYLTQIEWISIGSSRHRRFTEEDVKAVSKIKQLIEDGNTLRSAAEKALADARKD
jgi:DNA-binding transcriptional MerR regulator